MNHIVIKNTIYTITIYIFIKYNEKNITIKNMLYSI